LSLSVTLADANILVSRTLRDYFVYAAKAGALQIHWSQSILDEMSRNLRAKFAFTDYDTAVLELGLSEYLPRALVETRKRDHEIVEHVAMDAKDRHVLASALSAKADVQPPEQLWSRASSPHPPPRRRSRSPTHATPSASLGQTRSVSTGRSACDSSPELSDPTRT
jgi:predicted nucleic acid-binding protein